MKKVAGSLLSLLLLTLCSCGQPASNGASRSPAGQKNDSVMGLVKKYFNAKSVDSMYALTGERFRKQISPGMVRNVTDNNLFPLGEMKQAVFLKDADKVSIYKAVFASATLQMVIGLDPADKLEAFAFQPYEDESAGKTGPVASNNPLVTAQDRIVDSVALGYMRRLAPVGLSIGILRNGKTSFYGYGEATKGEGNVPGARTLFEIGSITKTFTATMLGLAVGEGKMSLDDPVNK